MDLARLRPGDDEPDRTVGIGDTDVGNADSAVCRAAVKKVAERPFAHCSNRARSVQTLLAHLDRAPGRPRLLRLRTQMIYSHTMDRAVRYYPERTALYVGGDRLTFRELHSRVMSLAAELARRGFNAGDRLALLLPNGPEYLEWVYACSRLGVISVPLNTRLSVVAIDHVLTDASPRGLVRHSSLPAPSVRVTWEVVIDHEAVDGPSEPPPAAYYDP